MANTHGTVMIETTPANIQAVQLLVRVVFTLFDLLVSWIRFGVFLVLALLFALIRVPLEYGGTYVVTEMD